MTILVPSYLMFIPSLLYQHYQQDLNLVQTSCFALSNMARGEGANQDALVKAGLIKPLLHHLRVDTVSTHPPM